MANSALFSDYVVVSCGVLHREINSLKEEGFLNAKKILFTPPGLHAKPDELVRQLTKQLKSAKKYSPEVIVLYGDKCHPDIDQIIKKEGEKIQQIDAQNCIDMLTDAKQREKISQGENILWISPGWLENWKRIYQDYLGWDDADANQNFPGFYAKAVFLDALDIFNEYPPETILEFSDWTRLVVEPQQVSLNRLKRLLLEKLQARKEKNDKAKLEPKTQDILGLLKPDFEAVEKGKARQASIGRNEPTDYLPLIINGMPVPEKERYRSYNHKEQFYDKEKMLVEQIWGLIAAARARSDAQLCANAKMGAGFLPTVFGLKQRIFEDIEPWLKERLTREEVKSLKVKDLQDISEKGLMPQALEYIEYFRKRLGKKACVYVSYTWGPFSLAHLIRGDEIFTDLYDDPSFVHHLMEIATELYIQGSRLPKRAASEPIDVGYHGNFYMSGGGVWSNEDTAVLLSASQAEEFVFPYLRKAFRPFGGGVVHFCGDGNHILDGLLDLPEVKGINFGEPELHPYEEVMQKLLRRGKVYYGGWPREKDEDTETYFRRLLKPLEGEKRSLVLAYSLTKEEKENPQEVMDLWHSLQDALD